MRVHLPARRLHLEDNDRLNDALRGWEARRREEGPLPPPLTRLSNGSRYRVYGVGYDEDGAYYEVEVTGPWDGLRRASGGTRPSESTPG